MRIWSILVSLTLHASLVFLAIKYKPKQNNGALQESGNTTKIIVKINKKPPQEKELANVGDPGNNFLEKKGSIQKECKYSYYGVGWIGSIMVDGWCRVEQVAPDSPLDRLGIPIGGFVKASEEGDCPGRGEEGTEVIIVYKLSEYDVPKTAIVIREKICMD